MANNLIQVKRTSVSGRAPNTSILSVPGELALNMADGILYSTSGSNVFEIGANNTNVNVTNLLTSNLISTKEKISVGNNTVNTEITAGVIRLNGSEIYIGSNTTLTGNSVTVGGVEIKEDAVLINGQYALTSETAGVANNSLYLGGVAANQYLTTTGSYTVSGNYTFNGNVSISKVLANSSVGSDKYVLTSNSTGGVYWALPTYPAANVSSDQFTANGSQTAFALSSSIANQNNAIVIVNGLVQAPTLHYTISGSTLNFNFTLPADSFIEVKSLDKLVGYATPNTTPATIIQSFQESYAGEASAQTGTVRKFFPTDISVSKLTTWTTPAGGAYTITLKKNGVVIANVDITAGSRFGSTTVSSTLVADTDYLTVDISSGSANNIGVRVDYTAIV